MTTRELIQEHENSLSSHWPSECGHCRENSQPFKLRGVVERGVRFVEGNHISSLGISVNMFLCLDCRRFFRHLPNFIKKFKRFITSDSEQKAIDYLTTPSVSYRDEAEICGNPRPYNEEPEVKDRSMVFSKTTIWAWISMWAAMYTELKVQKSTNGRQWNTVGEMPEVMGYILAGKYQTYSRRQTLIDGIEVLFNRRPDFVTDFERYLVS